MLLSFGRSHTLSVLGSCIFPGISQLSLLTSIWPFILHHDSPGRSIRSRRITNFHPIQAHSIWIHAESRRSLNLARTSRSRNFVLRHRYIHRAHFPIFLISVWFFSYLIYYTWLVFALLGPLLISVCCFCAGKWCPRREWSAADSRSEARRGVLYSSVFLGSPGKYKAK